MLTLFFTLVLFSLNSQRNAEFSELSQKFSDYQVLTLDSKSIYERAKSSQNLSNFIIELDNGASWDLNLRKSEIISPTYEMIVATEDGLESTFGTTVLPMVGKVNGVSNSEVALTFNEGFVYGFIRLGADEYYIEPVKHLINNQTPDKFVIYSPRDIIKTVLYECAYEVQNNEIRKIKNQNIKPDTRMVGQCFEIKYSNASDWSMVTKYGNSTGVENHNFGVMNNVQTNYDNEFADEIQFIMTQQWVSACSTCDPWSTSTDASTLLNSFTSWGPSNLTQTHNLAGLWTNRDLDGGTVGIAWVGVLCSNNRYHVLQDFTSDATSLRVMVAHEIGHNFNASHDASGSSFIMAPSVNSSTTWSSASISAMQNEYLSATCLSTCAGGGSNLPSADFTYVVNTYCVPGQVQYFDVSSNSTSRTWTFPGGSPSTSTALNPIVTYSNSGTYGATLTAFNSNGNSVKTVSNVVSVFEPAIANYNYTINGNIVSFTFSGSGAFSYFWTFGDGTSSFEQNPIHTFQNDGLFTVSLSVTNDCGTAIENKTINIVNIPSANFSASSVIGCQELTVNFTNTSSNNSQTYLWTFPGGNPSTSTLFSPTVVYPFNGVYDVSLEVTNAQGSNTNVKQSYINVLPLPVPFYSVSVNQNTAQFTNISQYQISSYWEFGDGTTSTMLNPSHVYSDNGTFIVTLHSINNCDTVVLTQTVTIAVPPVASFTPSSVTSICAGEMVNFQSNSGFSPSSYSWVFQGGNPSTSTVANPTVTYANGGSFDVTLIVTNAYGSDTLKNTSIVNVSAAPNVSFAHIDNDLTITFTSSVNNGTNLIWNFGDGNTSTLPNPIHTYAVSGTYIVSLTAENGCGPISFTQNIIAQLQPVAGFSASQTTACNPSSINFMSMSSGTVTSWSWTFEGGSPSTSTLKDPVVSYASTGTYNVSLIVTNSAGKDTLELNDYINIITVPTASFTQSLVSNIITLTNTGLGASSTKWDINGPNGSMVILNGSPANFSAPENGIYTIIQTNTNECGSTLSSSQMVTINAFPVSNFSISNQAGACEDVATIFTNLSTSGTNFIWLFEGGSPAMSTDNTPSVIYENAGNYNVQLIALNALGADTLTLPISVGAQPQSGFSEVVASGNISFTFTGSATSSYLWMFGDGATSTLQNPSHTYPVSGSYEVKQISINACGQDTTSKILAIIGTSVYDSNLKRNVTVSPNPNNGIFNISINDLSTETYQISLFDVLGNKLYHTLLNGNGSEINHSIDVSHLSSASYLVRITTDKASIIKKVIIQK